MRHLLISAAVCFLLLTRSFEGPTSLADTDCRGLMASANNKCCDPDGASTKCPAVTPNCPTQAPPGADPPGVTRNGRMCNPEGHFCYSADEGPYDAECEGSWFSVNCNYNADKTECNQQTMSACNTAMQVTKHSDGTQTWTYSCSCPGGVPNSTSMTRTECSGDACFF